MSSGSPVSKRITSPVEGCSKSSRAACSAWRPNSAAICPRSGSGSTFALVAKLLAVVAIADQRMADMGHVNADLVGAAGFQPCIRQGLRPACRAGGVAISSRATRKWVTAWRASGWLQVARPPVSSGRGSDRPRKVSIVPVMRSGARPRPRPEIEPPHRRRFGHDRRTGRSAPAWARSFLATTMTPDWFPCRDGEQCPAVSPHRCLTGCRRNSAISALTSVPAGLPGPG